MNEQDVRALVREVIARHAGGVQAPPGAGASSAMAPAIRGHASHGLLLLPTGADTDGPCLIEPAVACNHCGYCKSYGH